MGPIEHNPYNLGQSRFWDSPSLALANALSGDWEGVKASLTEPSALTPDERRKLSDRLGLTGTPMAWLADVATNPLVLVGAILTMKFKLPTAAQLRTYTQDMKGIVRSVIPGMAGLGTYRERYRGTDVPELLEGISQRYLEFSSKYWERARQAIGNFYKQTGQQTLSQKDQVIVGALLDGLDDPAHPTWEMLRERLDRAPWLAGAIGKATAYRIPATEAHRALAGDVRKIFDDVWGEVFDQAENQKDILRVMKAQFGWDDNVQSLAEAKRLIKREGAYWPHMEVLPPEERQKGIFRYIRDLLAENPEAAGTRALRQAKAFQEERIGTRHAIKRRGAMILSGDDARLLGLDDEVATALDTVSAADEIKQYSLSARDVIPRYLESVGRAYSWSIKPTGEAKSYGQRMAEEVRRLFSEGSTLSMIRGRELQDVHIPQALGTLTIKQSEKAHNWARIKERAVESLTTGSLSQVLPSSVKNFLVKTIAMDPAMSWEGTGDRIANYIFLSTLGGNPLPAVVNLLQPLTTGFAVLGKDILHGYSEVGGRMGTYYRALAESKGDITEKVFSAVKKAFPEFHAEHMELDPLTRRATLRTMEPRFGSMFGSHTKVSEGWRKFSEQMMLPFGQTELFNRLVTFYGALGKATRELPVGTTVRNALRGTWETISDAPTARRKALDWANEVVNMTQFGSGPENRPYLTGQMWAPWRQFSTFPLRMAGFVGDLAVQHPGIGGRLALGSGLAYGIGRNVMGLDLSQALAYGSVPTPTEGEAFAPLPFVSPTLQMIGAAGLSASKGTTEDIRGVLPLLVPGGIAASRAMSALGAVPGVGEVSQPISRFTGRSYADYKTRTPDGRVAVYAANGALIGYFTPMQLVARAVSGNVKSFQVEQELTKGLIASRDRVRRMKRDFMQALYENDAAHALELQERYATMFPRSQGMPVRPQEIRSLHLRREVSRIERTLETLPADLREQYLAVISVSMGANFPALMGLSQAGAQGRTITAREPYRELEGPSAEERVTESLHGMKLSDKMRKAGIDTARKNKDQFMSTGGQTVWQAGSFTPFGG